MKPPFSDQGSFDISSEVLRPNIAEKQQAVLITFCQGIRFRVN